MSVLSTACMKSSAVLSASSRIIQQTTSRHRTAIVPLTSSVASADNGSPISTNLPQQLRLISSISSPFSSRKDRLSSPLSYTALRNKVTSPFQAQTDDSYVSPYADFFSNIEAGRTSLGTTEEMEQKLSELAEQKLDCGIYESDLRFRTTSYGRFALPPYVSPGEHRVTVTLNLDAIPWDEERGEAEKEILLQIVGSRYNPEKNELKLSSEKFASRIENKRYLVGMIEKIVSNSKQLANEFAKEDEATKSAS